MSAYKKALQINPNGHQNGHGGYGQPKANDDGKMKRIEKGYFHLRRQLEETERTTNTIKQILTTLRTEFDGIKDKNYQLEMEMIKLRGDRANGRKVKIAYRHRDNLDPRRRALNRTIHQIRENLQISEKKLVSVKNENIKLKRKVSCEREEFEGIIQRKWRKLEENCEVIKKLESGLKKEREKCDVQNRKLLSACEKLDTTLDQLEKYENKIATQNGLIEQLKCRANLLESALQENQKLRKWCVQAEKLIQNFEHANKKDKLEITKFQRRFIMIKGKLKQKQKEMDTILEVRNQLFGFVHEVCAISKFSEDANFPVETNQLSELAAHLKEILKKVKFNNGRTLVVTQLAEKIGKRRRLRTDQDCDTGTK